MQVNQYFTLKRSGREVFVKMTDQGPGQSIITWGSYTEPDNAGVSAYYDMENHKVGEVKLTSSANRFFKYMVDNLTKEFFQ